MCILNVYKMRGVSVDIRKDISDLIESGFTKEELAVKFEVSGITVYRWWKGISEPGKFIKKKIARMADLNRK